MVDRKEHSTTGTSERSDGGGQNGKSGRPLSGRLRCDESPTDEFEQSIEARRAYELAARRRQLHDKKLLRIYRREKTADERRLADTGITKQEDERLPLGHCLAQRSGGGTLAGCSARH